MTEFPKRVAYSALLVGVLIATGSSSAARDEHGTVRTQAEPCANPNGGITLPAGFCASVFADNVGHAWHLVVAPNGVVYVNTWRGRYYGNDTPPAGGFRVALQDTNGDGRADVTVRFGASVQSGSAGGTGIALYRGVKVEGLSVGDLGVTRATATGDVFSPYGYAYTGIDLALATDAGTNKDFTQRFTVA